MAVDIRDIILAVNFANDFRRIRSSALQVVLSTGYRDRTGYPE